jgi:hypothetical protein
MCTHQYTFYMYVCVCVCVFVALGIQRAMRMRRTIMSSVACPVLQYFSTLPHKRHDFRGKKPLFNIKCVFWFSIQHLSETIPILRRTERDMIKSVYWSSCTVPVILVKFYWNLNFLNRFSKKNSNIKFHQNPSSGSRVVPNGLTWRS